MRLSSVRIREVISLWSSKGVSAKPSCSFGLDAELLKSECKPAQMAFPPDSEHIKFLTRQIWGLQRDRRLTNRSTPPLTKEALGSLKYRLKNVREVMLRGWGQWKHCCWEPTLSECICMCTETKFVWKRTHMQDSQASKRKSNFGGWGGQKSCLCQTTPSRKRTPGLGFKWTKLRNLETGLRV